MNQPGWEATRARYEATIRRLEPYRRRDPLTLFEIAGFPHFENVASNVLQYFLDPSNDHGMGTAMLDALLAAMGVASKSTGVEVDRVRREEVTATGKRIDILVECQDFVLGIENKIRAPLYNDLVDYWRHMRNLAGPRDVRGVVLSLRPETPDARSGFTSVVYAAVFRELTATLKTAGFTIDSRDAFLLQDFIRTMSNQSRGRFMEESKLNFFAKEEHNLVALHREVERFRQLLRRSVSAVQESLRLPPAAQDLGATMKLWRGDHDLLLDEVVVDLPIPSGGVAVVDVVLRSQGWQISPWTRETTIDLRRLLETRGLHLTRHDKHPRRFVWPESDLSFNSATETVADLASNVIAHVWDAVTVEPGHPGE